MVIRHQHHSQSASCASKLPDYNLLQATMAQSTPVMCKTHIVATPLVLVADECRWRVGRMTMTGQNPSILRKTCPTATLSTKNSTLTALGLNSGLYSERPGTNCLSHAFFLYIKYTICALIFFRIGYTLQSVQVIVAHNMVNVTFNSTPNITTSSKTSY